MTKAKTNSALPHWVRNLRTLMEEQNFNPRSLSLKAGLNATAVRDMLEGRSQFPRYDTAEALADALGVSVAELMSDRNTAAQPYEKSVDYQRNLELLTEVIARLREEIEDKNYKVTPRDFAAMATTLYNRVQIGDEGKKKIPTIRPQMIHDLLDYEMLRQKRSRR